MIQVRALLWRPGMSMKVHFYATLRQVVGRKVEDVAVPEGTTVNGLLLEILRVWPELRPRLVDEQGKLQRHVHVMVNGRDAPYLERGMDTPLSASDTLDVFPPVGGGASDDSQADHSRVLTGIPAWLLSEYLEDLGGVSGDDGEVAGEGWCARVSRTESFKVGNLAVGQSLLEIWAPQQVLDQLLPNLERRLIYRAGG